MPMTMPRALWAMWPRACKSEKHYRVLAIFNDKDWVSATGCRLVVLLFVDSYWWIAVDVYNHVWAVNGPASKQ